MESSTPLNIQNDLRRKTLLKNAVDVSPLRKSSNSSISSIPLYDVTDDENERSNRRSNAEIQKRLSNLPQGRNNLNESYVKEQFVICTHLFTENKITTKNAWKLQIIDMLKPLCQKSNVDTLQVASTSIDISAKVYGIRVDDIHSDGLKLANNMARVVEKMSVQEQDDEEENDQQKGKKVTKRKKRKYVSGEKNTISTKTKPTVDSLLKLEPVDFSTRVNAETGSIDNLFTNVLKEDNTSCTFIFLDVGKTLLDECDPLVKNLDENENITVLSNLPKLESGVWKLNEPFNDFRVDEWDPDQEEKQLTVAKKQHVILDENGIPIPELDGSIQDIFETHETEGDDVNIDDEVQSIHEEVVTHLRGEIARIVDFRSVNDSVQTSEYSFNSIVNTHTGKFIDQIWAGPCHWKLKFIRRSTTKFSGQKTAEKENKVGKKRVQPEMLNFNVEVDLDFSHKIKIKRKPPSADINKITLPIQDQSCVKLMASIKELMVKPGVCPVEKKAVENQLDYDVNPYKYENPNDSLYCTQQMDENGAGDRSADPFDDNFDNDNEEHIFVERQNFVGDGLVDEPQMVSKSNIPFALKAKQMDMRKLKGAIWMQLTSSVNSLIKESQEGKVIPTSFSEMYRNLPEVLADKERTELTCPLAFVALLHLCNENNLHLVQTPGYKDFNIRNSV